MLTQAPWPAGPHSSCPGPTGVAWPTSLVEAQEKHKGRGSQHSDERQLSKGEGGQRHEKEGTGKAVTMKQSSHPA